MQENAQSNDGQQQLSSICLYIKVTCWLEKCKLWLVNLEHSQQSIFEVQKWNDRKGKEECGR